ncbi:MAG: 1-acyl-sn-glycerol-3-phosphate acyltransferase [Alphaproteobacteria bacterium]|nr:1-acyl-sn-glycerol-3-phosphate acyltransferase [Alphaproteobacteria bacterium]
MVGAVKGRVRAVARAPGVLGSIVAATAGCAAGRRLHHADPAARVAWRNAWLGVWCRAVLRVIGARVRVEGRPPARPFVLVANHQSYLDIPVLLGQTGAVFVARGDLSGWPLLGALSRNAEAIFIDRGRRVEVARVTDLIGQVLAQGDGVVFFPEGTSSDGTGVLPFHSSLLEPAVRLGMPVHYAAIRYITPPGAPPPSEALAWWGDMDFGPHLAGLLQLPGFEVRVSFGPAPITAPNRKALARQLHDAVAGAYARLGDVEA